MYGAVNNVDYNPQTSSHLGQLWTPTEQSSKTTTMIMTNLSCTAEVVSVRWLPWFKAPPAEVTATFTLHTVNK